MRLFLLEDDKHMDIYAVNRDDRVASAITTNKKNRFNILFGFYSLVQWKLISDKNDYFQTHFNQMVEVKRDELEELFRFQLRTFMNIFKDNCLSVNGRYRTNDRYFHYFSKDDPVMVRNKVHYTANIGSNLKIKDDLFTPSTLKDRYYVLMIDDYKYYKNYRTYKDRFKFIKSCEPDHFFNNIEMNALEYYKYWEYHYDVIMKDY